MISCKKNILTGWIITFIVLSSAVALAASTSDEVAALNDTQIFDIVIDIEKVSAEAAQKAIKIYKERLANYQQELVTQPNEYVESLEHDKSISPIKRLAARDVITKKTLAQVEQGAQELAGTIEDFARQKVRAWYLAKIESTD